MTAVASRSGDRAEEAARRWGLDFWYDSYEGLLSSPDIDAVYIGTPNSLHRPWTVTSLAAGKHVLIEKPLASNAEDALVMVEAATNSDLVAMEAFHWRYHPLVHQIRQVLDSGEIGEVERVEGRFLIGDGRIPRHDIRWQLQLAGGSLMDLGVYPAGWLSWVMGEAPDVVEAAAICPIDGVDGRMQAEFSWPNGAAGSLVASMIEPGISFDIGLVVRGSDGTLRIKDLLAPQNGITIDVESRAGSRSLPVPRTTTFHHQLIAFRDAVMASKPFPTTMESGWRIMGLIDDIYRAAGMEPRPAAPDQVPSGAV